ncbi:MAG: geranylgeranyl reductase family protein [Promethearchaeota archaeon]
MSSHKFNSDLVIVGAGPAGSCAAWESVQKRLGVSVSLFEEHPEIGKPLQCSGLVATDGLENLGLNLKKVILNRILRAQFIAPDFSSFEVKRGHDSMVVINRVALDISLAERARGLGCEYHLGHRVNQIHFDDNGWILHIHHKSKKKIHKSKVLISAEGAHARLTRSIGLSTPNKNWLFPALQYEFDQIQDINSDCVELYFGRKYAPGFFGWVIPTYENSARIGIAVIPWFKGKQHLYLKRFLKKHPFLKKRLKNSKIINRNGGYVPVSGPVKTTYDKNFMVIGDAAGQTKATTGGGVNIGGFCGRLAGLTARRIIIEEVPSLKACRDYQNQWRALFEPNLSIMKLFRRILTPLPDKTWNEIIKIGRETEIRESLKTSQIDLHGTSLLKYALKPHVFMKGFHLLPQALSGFLREFIT